MRPRLLDLFCGAGGAAMGYHRAGFEVVGVDINPQPHYPFKFIQADALTFPYVGFDAIHASPPCQAYSQARTAWNYRPDHPRLIEPTRERLRASRRPWVIENVERSPLLSPVVLCGSMFGLEAVGLQLRRHRLFECSFTTREAPPHCHEGTAIGLFGDHLRLRRRGRDHKAVEVSGLARTLIGGEAMGISWASWPGLREAIPPAYAEWIGQDLLREVMRKP